jgi:heme exporter protein D
MLVLELLQMSVRVRGGAGYRFYSVPWSIARFGVPVIHSVMERRQLLRVGERAEAHAVRSAV